MYTYPKNFLSVTQLIQKLKDAGMVIDANDTAEMALTTIGYYRLKGYSFHLIDPATKKYIKGTTLSDVIKLYHFDTELSHLLFRYLSQIEVALRSRLVNAFQITQDALVLNDPSVFKDKKTFWKNQSTIAAEISRSNDVFIEHNFNNHDGAVPIWAVVEVMSFGTISKIIKNMKTGGDSAFSELIKNYKFQNSKGQAIHPSKDMFTSWIQAVSIMRNICAHNGRIYNRTISTRPQKVSTVEILQNARVGTAVHCLPEWQAPVWVLTGFACYSVRKSRSYHAGFRKCSYTCCACYSPFPMLASAISQMEIGGNRRLVCQKAKRTGAVNGGVAVHLDH